MQRDQRNTEGKILDLNGKEGAKQAPQTGKHKSIRQLKITTPQHIQKRRERLEIGTHKKENVKIRDPGVDHLDMHS